MKIYHHIYNPVWKHSYVNVDMQLTTYLCTLLITLLLITGFLPLHVVHLLSLIPFSLVSYMSYVSAFLEEAYSTSQVLCI